MRPIFIVALACLSVALNTNALNLRSNWNSGLSAKGLEQVESVQAPAVELATKGAYQSQAIKGYEAEQLPLASAKGALVQAPAHQTILAAAPMQQTSFALPATKGAYQSQAIKGYEAEQLPLASAKGGLVQSHQTILAAAPMQQASFAQAEIVSQPRQFVQASYPTKSYHQEAIMTVQEPLASQRILAAAPMERVRFIQPATEIVSLGTRVAALPTYQRAYPIRALHQETIRYVQEPLAAAPMQQAEIVSQPRQFVQASYPTKSFHQEAIKAPQEIVA